MTERTLTSPAGETILVLDDDDFAVLAGYDGAASRSYRNAMQMGEQRLGLLRALWLGGSISDASGRAAAILAERAQPHSPETIRLPASILAPHVMRACIERKIRGKRTFDIRLVALPQRWLSVVERRAANVDAHEDEPGPAPLEPPAPVLVLPELTKPEALSQVAGAVAEALLAQVVEVLTHGPSAGRSAQLERDVAALAERLATQVGYVEGLRRDLRRSGDELVAVKMERDGLRQRLREAEHNLKVATSADAQRIIDAEVHKQVDKIMRQAPNGTHGPDDERVRVRA